MGNKMTSTPVSMNDESSTGSWIDINSASQIHSPAGDDSPELRRSPYSLSESAQHLGLISFQVERFLQDAQKSGNTNSQNNDTTNADDNHLDSISDMYLSDSDMSEDMLQGGKPMLDSLRRYHMKHMSSSNNNQANIIKKTFSDTKLSPRLAQKNSTSIIDQVGDSMSLLSRASLIGELTSSGQVLDWLWDWTAQPEYFCGQEWKVYNPKQDYLLQQRQLCGLARLARQPSDDSYFSGEFMSLLFFTNILSIIIGAGLTYMILMRKPDP